MIPRYSPPTLFYKMIIQDQKSIIDGFTDYYRNNATEPLKYDNISLEIEMSTYFAQYHETRLFKDLELVTLVRDYTTEVLDEKIVIEKYPELFV